MLHLLLLLLLLLLLSPLLLGAGAYGRVIQSSAPGVVTGVLTSLDIPGSTGSDTGNNRRTYYLQVQEADGGSGVMYRLVFCSAVPERAVPIGIPVAVSYDKVVDGVMHSCSTPTKPPEGAGGGLQHWRESSRRRRVLLGEKIITPRAPRILAFLTTFCGYTGLPAATPQEVNDLLFTGKGMERNRTLAGYYDTCSYGKVKLIAPNVKVLGPVEVPCNGSVSSFRFSTGQNFTADACNKTDNMPKWQLWLGEWARRVHGIVAEDYHHRVLILPKEFVPKTQGCGSFAGLATPGRWGTYTSAVNSWGYSFVWWSGDNFGDIEILLHEIGHNYGMAHAATAQPCGLWDQCDNTCTMGAYGGQGIRCFNAPHNWQLGWGRPYMQLPDASLKPGAAIPVTIPLQMSSPFSSVIVTGAGLPPTQRLFLSARRNTYPYDLPYFAWEDSKVSLLMHTYNGTDSDAAKRTILVGQIQVGRVWRDSNSNLVIRFDSWNNATGAVVRICRRLADKEATCGDVLDDDCDFLEDAADPDCAYTRPPPKQTPLSPRPPAPSQSPARTPFPPVLNSPPASAVP